MTDSIQHRGSGPNPRRQEGPHAHSIVLDPHNRFAFAPDLGLDKIMVYRFDRRRGTLRPNRPGWVSTAPGAGPRHFCFHPDGRHAYAINELNSTLDAFAYGAENGSLERLATVSTLPDSFRGQNTCADVHVAPSGKFVYGSNRGHDSIAIFRVDSNRGTLTRIACEPTRGRTPRNFAIDPSGSWLLVANQNTGNLVVFRVDPITGMLRPTGQEVKVPSPVCIRFLPHGQ